MIYSTTLFATFFMAVLIVLLPRKYFMLPFILCACFIPADQRIIIMDLDFTPLRILVAAGFFWIFLTWPHVHVRPNKFDILVFVWAICGAIIYCIQWVSTASVIHQCGVLFDIFGLYLIFTKILTSWDSVRLTIRIFAVLAVVTAVMIGMEWFTGKNPFLFLGQVHTVVREGRYRCEGPFPHSIICGLFWGLLVPLFIGMSKTERKKFVYRLAAVAGIFIVAASASSTPVLSLIIVLAGVFLFKWRRYVPAFSWCVIIMLTGLHLIMKAPVWHLLSRVNIIGGSTGWHRYNLIDQAIKHFGEWAVLGCRSTEHWGWGMRDITNQFIYEGVRGGFVTLLAFLVLLFFAFKAMFGCSIRETSQQDRLISWCFFVSLVGHCAAFLAVSYFGQIMMLWYMMLAIASLFTRRMAQLRFAAEKQNRRIAHCMPDFVPDFVNV